MERSRQRERERQKQREREIDERQREKERERKRKNIARKKAFFNIEAKKRRIAEEREIEKVREMERVRHPWRSGYVIYKIGHNISVWEVDDIVRCKAEREKFRVEERKRLFERQVMKEAIEKI